MSVERETVSGLPLSFIRSWTVRRPLLAVGSSVTVATAVALCLPTLFLPWLAAVVALLLLIPVFRRPLAAVALVSAALCLVTCFCYRHFRVDAVSAMDGRQDTVTGRVLSVPDSGRMFTVEITDSTLLPDGTRVAVYLTEVSPTVGDSVTALVELSKPTFHNASRQAQGVFLYAFPVSSEEEAIHIDSSHSMLRRLPTEVSKRLNRTLNGLLPTEERNMIAALCLGEKSAVSDTTGDAFNGSGLSHLLVVSGLHLSLLSVAVWWVLRRMGCGYRLSAALTIPFVLAFTMLVGATPSVCRAAVMCIVWLVGLMIFRRADGLNSLGLAATILLLYNPYYLLSPGFQLSFAATAGVVTLTPPLCRNLVRFDPNAGWLAEAWRRVRNYIHSGSAVCIGAMLMTLPIACYYYNGFSLLSLPANLLAVPPAGWILVVGWLGMLCCLTPLLSWLGQPLLLAAGYLCRYLRLVAQLCSPRGSFLTLPRIWGGLLVTALCVIIVYVIRHPISRRRLIATLSVMVILMVSAGIPITQLTTEMRVARTSSGVVLTIRHRGRTAVLATDSNSVTAADAGDDPTFIFVGEGDAAHTATLQEMSRRGAAVYTADDGVWAYGCATPPKALAKEESVPLWESATLTAFGDGWFRVDVGAETVWLCGNPEAPPPSAEGVIVYGGIPQQPTVGYAVVATSTAQLQRYQPLFSSGTLVLTESDESVIFTARQGGEWSVWPWQ